LTCGDTQNIIKNYESYVINWTRQLAIHKRRLTIAFVLVRAPSDKLQATSSKSLKLQAASIKPQAQRLKLKATSNKLVDLAPFKKFQAP
jgi:hypothetical protein